MHMKEIWALAPLTTLGIGGPARWFVEAASEDEVAEAARWARERGVALFVLGGGSNLLVSDAGFAGLECLAGIPGTVGGTPVQNVGAYGQEVASVIERVRVFDLLEHVFQEFTA